LLQTLSDRAEPVKAAAFESLKRLVAGQTHQACSARFPDSLFLSPLKNLTTAKASHGKLKQIRRHDNGGKGVVDHLIKILSSKVALGLPALAVASPAHGSAATTPAKI